MAKINIVVKVLSDAAQASLRNLTTKSSKAESSFKKLNKQTSVLNGNLKLLTGIVSGVALAGLAKTALNVYSGMIKVAGALETTSVKFEVLTGSIEVANKLMHDLEEFSATTPFQFTEIEDAATSLLAFGFTVDQVKVKVREIGDIAAATGKDYRELAVVFGQVKSAGRLTGERLLQLQERSVPIMAALAKSMNMTETSVRAMVQKGKVSFADFEKAWSSMSKAGGFAFEGMEKRSKTLEGRLSTLKDNWVLLSNEIGKKALPLFKASIVTLSDFIKQLKNNQAFDNFITSLTNRLPAAVNIAISLIQGLTNTMFYAMRGMNLWSQTTNWLEKQLTKLNLAFLEIDRSLMKITGGTEQQLAVADKWILQTRKAIIENEKLGMVLNDEQERMSKTQKEMNKLLDDSRANFQKNYELEKKAAEDRANAKDASGKREVEIEQRKYNLLELLAQAKVERDNEAYQEEQMRVAAQSNAELQFLVENLGAKEAARVTARVAELENEGLHQQALEKLAQARDKAEEARAKKEKKRNDDIISARGTFLAHISTLQNASSKELVAIGKAAALAQITINTAESASAGMLWGTRIGGPALGAIFAGLAYTAGAAQAAQVMGAKFRDGGIVGGNQVSGDQVQARLNSGEMVLNKQQQTNLFKMAQQGGGSEPKEIVVHSTVELDGEVLARSVSRSVANGVELGEFE